MKPALLGAGFNFAYLKKLKNRHMKTQDFIKAKTSFIKKP